MTSSEVIVQQAIAWRIRLGSEEVSEIDKQACQYWRDSDPRHERAWQRLENMESGFRQTARRTPGLTTTLNQTDAECRRMGRRKALRMMGGSALSLAGVAWLAQHQGVWQQLHSDFNTHGQRQAFQLQDGSRLWLNHDSSVALNFSSEQRQLVLTRGEMHLETAADPRPFQVLLPQAELATRQGQFMVRRGSDASLLHVQQGDVQVQPQQVHNVHMARTGEAVRIEARNTVALDARRFDYSSWIDGLLVARGMPMNAFMAEFERYHSGLVRIHPSLQQHPVSGVYQLQDTHLVLTLLARSARAELSYRSRWWADIRPAKIS